MKKYILSLMAALVVFSVLAGCTGKPEPTPTPDNKPGSVEVGLDDPDLSDMSDDDHQTEGDFGDIDVSFKDPNNSDGIVVTPKETKNPTPSTTPESSPASYSKANFHTCPNPGTHNYPGGCAYSRAYGRSGCRH